MSKAIVHSDIDIRWQANGHEYRAMGFIKKGEPTTPGHTAFERVEVRLAQGWKIVETEEEWALANQDSSQFPIEMSQHWFVTKCPYPGRPGYVSVIYYVHDRWFEYWLNPAHNWQDFVFVLCYHVL